MPNHPNKNIQVITHEIRNILYVWLGVWPGRVSTEISHFREETNLWFLCSPLPLPPLGAYFPWGNKLVSQTAHEKIPVWNWWRSQIKAKYFFQKLTLRFSCSVGTAENIIFYPKHLLLESKKTKVETRQSKLKCANASVGTQELM
jgi:hypothetical protein